MEKYKTGDLVVFLNHKWWPSPSLVRIYGIYIKPPSPYINWPLAVSSLTDKRKLALWNFNEIRLAVKYIEV